MRSRFVHHTASLPRSMRRPLSALLAFAMLLSLVPMGAIAVPAPLPTLSSPTGLTALNHADEATWYSDSSPLFSWESVQGSDGYSYSFDQQASDPALDDSADPIDTTYVVGDPGTAHERGRDITVGDMDGDGDLDAVSGASIGEAATVVVTDGSPSGDFGGATTYDLGKAGAAESVALGDLDGDGDLDVVAVVPRRADWEPSATYVLFNDGTGALGTPVPYATLGRSAAVEIADFDKDGNLDLAVVCSGHPNQLVMIYRGVGDGTFNAPTTTYVYGGAVDLTVGDINGDSWLDLVTVTEGNPGQVTLVYNSEGTFPASSTNYVQVGEQACAVDLGDVNEDGYIDIVTGNGSSSGRATVLMNQANSGTFDRTLSQLGYYYEWGSFRDIDLVDADGDSHLDAVVFSYDMMYAQPRIKIFKGYGDGTFNNEAIWINVDGEVRSSFASADLNGDGALDFAFMPWLNSGGVTPVIAGPTKGYTDVADGEWYFHIKAVGDGGEASEQVTRKVQIDTTRPTLELTGVADGGVYVAGEAPQVTLTATDAHAGVADVWAETTDESIYQSATGDTLVFDLPAEPGVYSFNAGAEDNAGNEEDEFSFTVTLVGAVADLTSPSHPDPDQFYSDGTVKFTWNTLPGALYSYDISSDPNAEVDVIADPVSSTSAGMSVFEYPSNYYPQTSASGDFDDDGDLDFAVGFDDDYGVLVYLNKGDGTFETDADVLSDEHNYYTSGLISKIKCADMDFDGNLDLVVLSNSEPLVGILYGLGDGTFEDVVEFETTDSEYPEDMVIADVNGWGGPEIILSYPYQRWFEVMYEEAEAPRYYTAYAGSWDLSASDVWADSWSDDYLYGAVATGDIDGDGSNDVVLATDYGRLVVALNDGWGIFSAERVFAIEAENGDSVEQIVLRDFNGDGRVDILTSSDEEDMLFLNDGEGGFSRSFYEYSDFNSGHLAVGDFNGDEVLDFAFAYYYEDEVDGDWVEGRRLELRLGDGNGDFSNGGTAEFNTVSNDGQGISAADVNNDGLDDLIVCGDDDYVYVVTMAAATDYNAIVENLEDGIWYFRVRQVAGDGDLAQGGPTSTFQVNIGEAPETFTLTYLPVSNGSIQGDATQEVWAGSLGTTVTAIPDPGYRFNSWTDGLETAERRDLAVADRELLARFDENIRTIENDDIRVTVSPQGEPQAYVWSDVYSAWISQYYGDDAWGTVVWLDDMSYTSGYVNGDAEFTPVTNEVIDIPGGQQIVTVVMLGDSGVHLTQTFTLMDGDRHITKEWSLSNLGELTFEDVRLYHGGDTYFGGEDSASGYFDESKSMVYVRNRQFANWGIMGFYANPATPATHYFEGGYSTGNSYALGGTDLPDTVDATYRDAGYYLQWDAGTLAPEQSWSAQGYELWTPGGALQVLAPGSQNVIDGSTVILPFTLQNLSEVPQDITLAADATGDWSARILGTAAPEVGAAARTQVLVEVTVPEGATGYESVSLTASGPESNASGETRLAVVDLDVDIAPSPVSFEARVGETSSSTVTVTNNSNVAVTLGAPSTSSPFAIEGEYGQTVLDPGGHLDVTVKYTAGAVGTVDGIMSIAVLAPERVTLSVALAGTSKPLAPPAPTSPYFRTTGRYSSVVTWGGNGEAIGYNVLVNGIVVGRAGAGTQQLTISGALGPLNRVEVVALGETENSPIVRAAYLSSGAVSVGQLQFGGYATGLTRSAKREIQALAALIKQQGYTYVQVDGHAAQALFPGSKSYRQRLSLRRATAVQKYLVSELAKRGVRIQVVAYGHGSEYPVATNKTWRGRAANRRVEISFR